MDTRVPSWMIVVIVLQAALAALTFYCAYLFGVSMARGGAPSTAEILFLATPMAIVAVCGTVAWWNLRAGRHRTAVALVWAPVPVTILLIIILVYIPSY